MTWRFTPQKTTVFFKVCLMVVLALALIGMTTPAIGYVLRGPHLLKLMTENMGRTQNLVVDQTLLIFDPTTPGAFEEVSETLTYRFPTAFRADSRSDMLNRIHVDTIDDSITVYDEKISLGGDELFDRYKDLLFLRSRVLLQERLAELGMDPSVSSLGRYEKSPIFVLGAQYPDESVPQVWIEKESFRPVRWLIPYVETDNQVALFEIRYLEWERHHNMWYPMKVQCYRGGQLIREILVEQLMLAGSPSDEMFDIDYLRMRYARPEGAATETPAQDTRDDIQKVIEDFKRRYEQYN